MLPVLITIDTEYSSGLYRSGRARGQADNFARTIACRSDRGEAGLFHQLRLFAEHGITASFFVDPMSALVWGQGAVDAVVEPILAAGHEVQLHCHTEWLDFADGDPFGPARGHNIRDFPREVQTDILGWARDRLVAAGAPAPSVFRAGNYGANDDTLHALAALGIAADSSATPGYADTLSAIACPPGDCRPFRRHGVQEWPVAAIHARGGYRHGQIAALSFAELRAAIAHAAAAGWPALVLVSHSFELYDRHGERPYPLLMRRFARLCQWLGESGIAHGVGFAALMAPADDAAPLPLLPHSWWRTLPRMAEQALVR